MSDDMTGVYSGGLMYEYSMEDNKYGIVEIEGEKVKELKEFGNLAKAMKKYPAPSGDGGAAKTTQAVECPTQDADWEVDPDILPAIPKEALTYFKDGAGKGKGFKGSGSQTAGDSGLSVENSTDASSPQGSSGSGGSGSGSDDDNAAGHTGANALFVTGSALAVTLLGAAML